MHFKAEPVRTHANSDLAPTTADCLFVPLCHHCSHHKSSYEWFCQNYRKSSGKIVMSSRRMLGLLSDTSNCHSKSAVYVCCRRKIVLANNSRTRGNGQKPEHRKFHTSARKNFFSAEWQWSPLLWRYSRPIWTPTCVAYCRAPALLWQGGWSTWSLEVPFNPYSSVILWFSFPEGISFVL